MLNKKLYQNYHKGTKPQKRIINNDDFTYKNILWSIHDFTPKTGTVLDIGSATGTLGLYFASKGLKVVGIELSKTAVEYSNLNKKILNLKNIQFLNTSIEEFHSATKFDLITCFEVLEHVENDINVLKKVNKMMRRDSIFAISVPSVVAPLYKIGLLNNFDKRVGHLRRYKLTVLKQKIKKANFTVVKTYSFEGVVRNSLYTSQILGKILKITRFKMINRIISILDNFSIKLFGPSQYILICKKA